MHIFLAATWLCGGAAAQAQDAPVDDSSAPAEPAPSSDEPPAPEEPPLPEEQSAEDILSDVDAFLAGTPDQPAPGSSPTTSQSNANAFNPQLTAFGDLLLVAGFDDVGMAPGSGPFLRSFELDVRADVDPFAKAVAVLAVEQEPPPLYGGSSGEEPTFSASPEEVYIDLVSLPGHLSARLGQFKLPFGLTNRMHPHDWPWPDAPPSFATALGEEGMAEAAAMLQYQVHNPWNKALTLTAAATAGDAFDPNHLSAAPGFLGRAEYFDDFGQIDIGLGASSVGWTDQRVDGADLMLRWRADSWHSIVLISEIFRPVDGGEAALLGWTGTLQLQPTRPLYLGLRVDQVDKAWQYAGYLSYYTSEFLRVRVGASTDGASVVTTGQLTFVWGSHPVEPYWVNR